MAGWDKYRIFYYVANFGGINKAAEKLNTTPSGVSRHIKDLEHDLKFPLFRRDGNVLKLTAKGEDLFKHVSNMHDEANAVENFWKGREENAEGELVIVTSPGVAATWLPNYIPGFMAENPDIRLNIRTNLDFNAVEGNEIHIRAFMPNQPALVQNYLTSFHMSLFASREYLKKFGTPETIKDLDQHKILMFGESLINLYGNTNWALLEGTDYSSRKPYMKVNSDLALFNLATRHLGIVELPEEYPGIKENNLVKVLPHYKPHEVKVYYIYLKHYQYSKRIIAFREYFEQCLNSNEQS